MLLALETATDVCSVALIDSDGHVAGVAETLEPRSHAARLVPLTRDLLAEHDLRTSDLSAVAVSAGPGSYTGLRIGASTAKGLAWIHDLDLVAVPSLEALAWQVACYVGEHEPPSKGGLVTAFRSRRGEAYVAFFSFKDRAFEQHGTAAALPLEDLAAWLPDVEGPLLIAGEAGAVVADALDRQARVLSPETVRPSAAAVGVIGWERWQAGETVDVAAFEPDYLKDFVAKRGGSIFERLPK